MSGPTYQDGWSIRFTDDELNAIYAAIENAPADDTHDEAWQRVIDKITPDSLDDARPSGAFLRRVAFDEEVRG